jgi:CubicO group peptidase (beta-lactamase class C family)
MNRSSLRLRVAVAFLAGLVSWSSPSTPLRAAESPRLDPARLDEIPARIKSYVDDGTVAGAVALVARKGGVERVDVVGWSDLETRKPMRADSMFWIASMTKPITATAILILRDEGKLAIDDPVEKHLPEFRGQWLVSESAPERRVLVRPPRPITLRDLLTHTSGIGGGGADAGRELSLAEQVLLTSQEPLRFAPGTRWEYSNVGINTLGRVVEVVSRTPYADFLEARILRPLGMKDTTFWPTEEQIERVAKSYKTRSDGKGLEEAGIPFLRGDLTSRMRTPFPAGGLFSTAADLARFYRAILLGGELDGVRIVSSAAIEEMTRTQTGDLTTGFTSGMSFGLGWAVVKEPRGVTAVLSPGTYGHGGAYGTQGWIDPGKDLILVLMVQRANFPNADESVVRRAFQDAAVGALAK